MTPQLIAPLIQLPLVDPQLLGQLLGTAALHPLHRSALLFPTPTSISLPTLHSMLHGEFSSCLILGGHSTTRLIQGVSTRTLSTKCAGKVVASVGRTPGIGMAEDAPSGFLDYAL